MTPSLIISLCNIALKPDTSPSTRIITTRRICRRVAQQIDSIHAERRSIRREATKLKLFLPFTQQAITALEQQAQEHREDERSGARRVLAGFGDSLLLDREGLAEALGFDRLCDLLNVNTKDREEARKEGASSLEDLVFIHVLEDSAERRGQEWNDAPLFRACLATVTGFIKECPDQLPDMFAPGAPLGPKLPPKLSLV
ncbi:hypothetical protein [Pseudomonas sp.]|uniref:hypothetical protein n=1 Tax=Pseudomonas sp. TaxID=306 RepID=UPI00260B1AFB|nr:hypothetical protein [Pseudomonas sp.]